MPDVGRADLKVSERKRKDRDAGGVVIALTDTVKCERDCSNWHLSVCKVVPGFPEFFPEPVNLVPWLSHKGKGIR